MRQITRAVATLAWVVAAVTDTFAYEGAFDGNYDPKPAWTDGFSAADDRTPLADKIAALRAKVKFVFVIFQENNSFDHYFGTFPGANGLFEAPKGFTPAKDTRGFNQAYLDADLKAATIRPFLLPQAVADVNGKVVPIYPADVISVDHSHQGMANGLDVDPASGLARNDRYAMDQEGLTTDANGAMVTGAGVAPTAVPLAAKQKAEIDMSHIDCDTIPFMWSWAKNFVLFDNFRQTIVGPSTPNAIAVIAGQSGQTQWALHPGQGATPVYADPAFHNVAGVRAYLPLDASRGKNTNAYVPLVADPGPFPGSKLDPSPVKPPYNVEVSAGNPAPNLTFATQPLSFMGADVETLVKSDPNPAFDLLDVQNDIRAVAAFNKKVAWGWYQQGYDAADQPDPFVSKGPNSGYVVHHNGPQYFGYLADNPAAAANLHGAADFFRDVDTRALPQDGGVFYLRGGFSNNDGLKPLDPTPGIQNAFLGNDDHPAYSDQQISEAFAARAIAAIADSPYWPQSAIIVTYDETDGFYDHEPPHVRNLFADGSPLAGGPRIPTLVISPYAATGKISHRYSEHGSILKFINELKGLIPLAALPDEEKGVALGKSQLAQNDLGPSDDPRNELGDLTEAFDYARLAGTKPPVPASAAIFSADQIKSLPHLAGASSANGYTNGACKAVGVLPTDFPDWAAYNAGRPIDPYPADVNPRPTQSPGVPTSGTWTP